MPVCTLHNLKPLAARMSLGRGIYAARPTATNLKWSTRNYCDSGTRGYYKLLQWQSPHHQCRG